MTSPAGHVLNSENVVLHSPTLLPGSVFQILSNLLMVFEKKLLKTYLFCRAFLLQIYFCSALQDDLHKRRFLIFLILIFFIRFELRSQSHYHSRFNYVTWRPLTGRYSENSLPVKRNYFWIIERNLQFRIA
jgi:hypothetical protein